MPMHQGSLPPGVLTSADMESRESQGWDVLVDVMIAETMEQYWQEMQDEFEHDMLSLYLADARRGGRAPAKRRPNGVQLSRHRQPRYKSLRDHVYGGPSVWRSDWALSMVWEHVGPEDVLANPDAEFENLTRLPRSKFDEICTKAAHSQLFLASRHEPLSQMPGVRVAKRCITPLVISILASLRHLATGDSWTSIQLSTHVHRSTLRAFYHTFMPWFLNEYYEQYVTGPSQIGFASIDEVEASEEMFRQLGFPGIITSMDGVCALV